MYFGIDELIELLSSLEGALTLALIASVIVFVVYLVFLKIKSIHKKIKASKISEDQRKWNELGLNAYKIVGIEKSSKIDGKVTVTTKIFSVRIPIRKSYYDLNMKKHAIAKAFKGTCNVIDSKYSDEVKVVIENRVHM